MAWYKNKKKKNKKTRAERRRVELEEKKQKQREKKVEQVKEFLDETKKKISLSAVFKPLKVIGTHEKEAFSPIRKPLGKIGRAVNKGFTQFWSLLRPIRWLLILLLVVVVLSISFAVTVFMVWGQDLPDVRNLKSTTFAETTTIYDRQGNILYKIFNEENRTYVPLDKINQSVIDATISIEDKFFYRHLGFDPIGIMRAQINNMNDENSLQGASTITQQLAKNLYLSPEKTLDRKVKELILAVQIEFYYTKDEILEMYLNKIPYGSNAFGIEAASETYFGKPSNELSLVEASILASLPKAPSKFSPYGSNKRDLMGYCKIDYCATPDDPNYVWGRKDLVLQRMLEDDVISYDSFENAWRDGFDIEFQDLKVEINAPHFVFYVKDYLEKKYGKEMVESGGLQVYTTLDPDLQAAAEKILADSSETYVKRYGASNAALVSLDPRTGGVLAMVGSLNYWDETIDGQVNITTSLRQPGSSFKPLVYANAIEKAGIGSGTPIGDYKTKFTDDYVPSNSDNLFKGRMTVKAALAQSRNIPAIKAWYIGGEEESLLEFLDRVGMYSLREFKDNYNTNPDRKWDFSYGPSMAIGSGEVRLIEMAGAFSAFANEGVYNPVNPILEVRDRTGVVLETFQDNGVRAMREDTAFIINSILSDVSARPAGSWRNALTISDQNVAAKTGTSNKKIGKINYPNNLLTIGYTPNILSITWVGNSDGSKMSLNAWGATAAAPINKAFLEVALKDKPQVEYLKPESVIAVGSQFYPSNWDKNKYYDSQFKPLVRKDCTDEERTKDPVICKTKAQQDKEEAERKAAEEAAKVVREPERPINTGDSSTPDNSIPVVDEPVSIPEPVLSTPPEIQPVAN